LSAFLNEAVAAGFPEMLVEKVLIRFCKVTNTLWLVLGATVKVSPVAGAPLIEKEIPGIAVIALSAE